MGWGFFKGEINLRGKLFLSNKGKRKKAVLLMESEMESSSVEPEQKIALI